MSAEEPTVPSTEKDKTEEVKTEEPKPEEAKPEAPKEEPKPEPPKEEPKPEPPKEEPKPEPPKEEPKPVPPKEEPKPVLETKPSNETKIFYISLPLIQKINELKVNEPQTVLLDYISSNGLPCDLECENCIALYLYFHQMLIPFCEILSKINSEEVKKVLMDALKEKFQLLSDTEVKHFNFDELAAVLKGKITKKGDDSPVSKIPIEIGTGTTTKGKFVLNKKLLSLGQKGYGRLDIYVKAHIIKSIILFLGIPELAAFTQNFQTMEDDLIKVSDTAEKEKFTCDKYKRMVDLFANGEKKDDWDKVLLQLRKLLIVFQNVNDQQSIDNLERLFVQLLGHFDREVRNDAVKILTMIYDESNWQEKNAYNIYNTKIKLLEEDLNLELKIKKADYDEKELILITNSPCENPNVKHNVITFIKSQNEDTSDGENVKLCFPLGKLAKCGYYDWYLAKFSSGRYTNVKVLNDENEQIDGKGRTIVLDKDIKDLSVHEVFCDLIGAQIDKQQGRIAKRGTFQNLEKKLDEYNQRYVNCLYIMGALERDNEIAYDEQTGEALDFPNPDASPMAVTSRNSISSLLGGDKAFRSLMGKAKRLSMKVILDSLARISSSRPNRKYRDILLHYLDNKGKLQVCYGTDGASLQYEDSAVLNYRKIDCWNLLIDEIKSLIDKYGIDGVHLDNCQAWPQIMEIDAAELYRIDNDGKSAYTSMEILDGEIVMPNEESGFYNTDLCDTYSNPFLVKLTKSIWRDYPSFVFFGECWLKDKSSKRHIVLSKSGVIPRMYTLPMILSEILGKKIQRDGKIEKTRPKDVSILKAWYDENYKGLPEGALLIQSSSGQIWPYPALLYGRGNWAAVDLLFALPDIPMTFMNEIDGEAYRVKVVNVYEAKDKGPTGSSTTNLLTSKKRSKSLMRLIESKQQEQREKEKTAESSPTTSQGSTSNLGDFLPSYNLSETISSLIQLSGIDVKQAKEIDNKQKQLVNELGPQQGFDLNKIKYHYDYRRKMRYTHESLRRGRLVHLDALDHNKKVHPGIFCFARETPEETGIFAINFTDQPVSFEMDLTNLLKVPLEGEGIDEESNFNSICYIEDWTTDSKGDFYFVREIIEGHNARKVEPYSAVCFGFSVIPFTKESYLHSLEKSNSRMINEIRSNGPSVDSYQTSLQLKEILDKKLPIAEFAKWLNYVLDLLSKYNINFPDYISKIGFIWGDDKYSTAFFKYCVQMSEMKGLLQGTPAAKLTELTENMVNNNILGPICFVTPELGRWSTVGGLGVMVDELSQGLQEIGQDLIMISPYYDRNKKGQTDYLKDDPFNIHYIRNIEVQLDQKYTFGVHYGEGNGNIKYYFLHNYKIFPRPYPDYGCEDTLRQICVFCKASLQLLCDIQTIPAIVMTNDWFTGLCAAYGKNGSFGDVFKGTTFFHICHNLAPTYEGRLYPSPQQGSLDHIHQVQRDWLVDPNWSQLIINPSRCALMISDQWGTVSFSYRDELLSSSPLAPILKLKSHPFAFCNGVFKDRREKALKEKAGGDRKACKAYIQKKYFGYQNVDFNVPIFSFVGRLTQQKGVLMILDAAEEVIRKANGKINILVGGMGTPSDPYVAACIGKINYLKGRYPNSFWADPNEFFTDGPKINLGSDFGLMPSLFEPGGIVQQEFFVAGTPVIAFRTGGLRDTVFEYNWDNNTGNGFTFDYYNAGELINAMNRAMNLFHHKEAYEQCRKNAYASTIDVSQVSRAWCREFYRLKGKIFFNVREVLDSKKDIDHSGFSEAVEALKEPPSEYIFQKKETEEFAVKQAKLLSNKNFKAYTIAPSSIINDGEIRLPVTFTYNVDEKHPPQSVQICGSFDKWQVRHPLTLDTMKNQWVITLKIKKGQYSYKYVVDGNWVINDKEPTFREGNGIVNNVIKL